MTTAAIVQARWGSSRLPGKVLLEIGGQTVLSHVLSRCAAIPSVDVVCCAVSDDPESDPVANEAIRARAVVVRGTQQDVLARYAGAARSLRADVILRVTSDCPLVDPQICEAVIRLRSNEDLDYACNNLPPAWPHGLDCEAFTRDALERANATATGPAAREHVTPWMRQDLSIQRASLPGPGGDAVHQRWTLDYPEDEDFLRKVFKRMPPTREIMTWQQVLKLVKADPTISVTNRNRHDKARLAAALQ